MYQEWDRSEGHSTLLSALVKRWRSETHSFVLSTSEVTSGLLGQPESMAIFDSEPIGSSSSKSYIKLAWVCHIRHTQPLDTWLSVQRYIRSYIFCLLGTTLFADKLTTYTTYPPLFQNFEHIGTYSRGVSNSRTSLQGIVSCMTRLAPADIPIACRWSHHPRTREWMWKSAASVKYDIYYIEEFVWRPYLGIIIPAELHHYLDVCDTVG
ncbi:hypothetical protein AHAS_Ahas18G0226900 [Arachis hypogaea]